METFTHRVGRVLVNRSKKRIGFLKVCPVLTPSGYHDNSKYVVSDQLVSFPREQLKRAILEEVVKKASDESEIICGRITVDGQSWLVQANPVEV